MKQTDRTKAAAYDGRLAELAASWFGQAKELDVYLQYEFTGLAQSPGWDGLLEAVDAMVTGVLRTVGARPQDDRWLSLTVDRQPERFHLKCISSGPCPADLWPLAEQGAETDLRQYPGGCDFTLEWRRQPENAEVDAPC